MVKIPTGKTEIRVVKPHGDLSVSDKCYVDGYASSGDGRPYAVVVRIRDGYMDFLHLYQITAHTPDHKKKPSQKFIKPTLQEVAAYIDEKGYSFSAEQWMAHYEANGWRVGPNPMKDWKAACRTWGKNKSFNRNAPESKEHTSADWLTTGE